MKNQSDNRRYFAFNRLYWLVCNSLPTLEKKLAFMNAIVSYGFDHIEPDFSGDPDLLSAWSNVLPDLSFGWNQHEQGQSGFAVKQAKQATSKALPKAEPISNRSKDNSIDFEHLPFGGNLNQSAVICSNTFGWNLLSLSPSPLTKEQINWIDQNLGIFGFTIANDLNNRIKDFGLTVFWSAPTNKGKSVFELIIDQWKTRTIKFEEWFAESFNRLEGMKNPLSYIDYCKACYEYGRANVFVKLRQMNNNPKLSKNGNVSKLLSTFIERSINTNSNNKFHLDTYNDNPSILIPDCPENYDLGFRFEFYYPRYADAIEKMNSSSN